MPNSIQDFKARRKAWLVFLEAHQKKKNRNKRYAWCMDRFNFCEKSVSDKFRI